MALGFPAHYKQSRQLNLQRDDLVAVVKSALENLGWSYEVGQDGEFIASLHNSPMTFGEEFRIQLLPNGELRVESKCVAGGMYRRPQIFDFDANKKNVEALFAQIDEMIEKDTRDNKTD